MASQSSVAFPVSGTRITVSPAWLSAVILAMAVTLVALAPDDSPTSQRVAWFTAFIVLCLGLLFSLLIHETAHAWMSRRVGRPSGRVRLYPFGGINDEFDDPGSPRQEIYIALAGPATSLIIALILSAIWLPLNASGLDISRWIGYLAIGNGVLALGNMLPGYPLDGGRVFRALVWYLHGSFATGTRAAVIYGQFLSIAALMSGAVLMGTNSGWAIWGIWIIVVSWAMNQSGRQEIVRSMLVSIGSEFTSGDVVRGLNPHVKSEHALDAALEVLLAELDVGIALVTREREVVGVIRPQDVRRYPRADWPRRTAGEAMLKASDLASVDAAVSVRGLLSLIDGHPEGIVLVTSNDDILGAIDRRIVLQRLSHRMHENRAQRSR